ncbi:hypothetical protein [Halosolutus gelatinilyticus]|nr:hypothetical protein [Halosolutus gelatinilyticus]
MIDRLFEFEEEKLPPAVVLATTALIAIFALGLAYRAIAFVAF